MVFMKRIVVVIALLFIFTGCAGTGKNINNNGNTANRMTVNDLDEVKLKLAVMSYFKTRSEFAGVYKIAAVSKMELKEINESNYDLNTAYTYIPALNNKQGKTDSGSDQRVFRLVFKNNGFDITGMGAKNSARFDDPLMEDSTRTKTEATVLGAGTGGVAGALIGNAFGGRDGAVKGAVAGAVIGGVAGYMLGDNVADKKQEYIRKEEELDNHIILTSENNDDLKIYNIQTAERIRALDDECNKLCQLKKSEKRRVAELRKKETEIKNCIVQNDKLKKSMSQEFVALNDYVDTLKKSDQPQSPQKVAKLEVEIAQLKENISALDNHNIQMARMAESLSVRK